MRPATRPRKDKSYADQFMQAPALRPATHYVVHSLHARFWVRSHSSFDCCSQWACFPDDAWQQDTVHALLLHQLGLERAVELRELGADQMLAALQRHCSLKGSLFSYHLDFLQRPVHMPTDPEALAEFEERRLKADRRALGEARNMAVVMHAAVETPAALREAALL